MSVVVIGGKEEFLKERAAYEEYESSLIKNKVVLKFNEFINIIYDLDPSSPTCYIVTNTTEIPMDLEFGVHKVVFILSEKYEVPKNIKVDKILQFNKLKIQENDNEVIRWIMKEGERFNIDLSKIAGALFVNSGDNLRKLNSEIEKIRTLVLEGTVVTPEIAKSIICFSADLNPKSIIDSVSSGKTLAAMVYYDRLQEQGEETGWITAFLFNFVIQILRSQRMIEKGIKDIPAVLSLNIFIYNNYVLGNINKWSTSSLMESARNCSMIEQLHRQGNEHSKFLLEQEIIRLSEEASLKVNQRS